MADDHRGPGSPGLNPSLYQPATPNPEPRACHPGSTPRTISTGRDRPRHTPRRRLRGSPAGRHLLGLCGQRRAARPGRRRPPLRGPWRRSGRRGPWADNVHGGRGDDRVLAGRGDDRSGAEDARTTCAEGEAPTASTPVPATTPSSCAARTERSTRSTAAPALTALSSTRRTTRSTAKTSRSSPSYRPALRTAMRS